MSTFKSEVTISKPINEVYKFLADLNNHQQLMPENIQDWVSTYDTASFNIQNMTKLSLIISNRELNTEVNIIPSEKPPFGLELKWSLSSVGDQTHVLFTIDADLNMMFKMIASGPLQKLADHETNTLVSIFS